MVRRVLWVGALCVYGVVLAALTLTPRPWAADGDLFTLGVLSPRVWLSSQTWTTGASYEFVANILLFFPGGLLLGHLGLRRALAVALVVTWGIEMMQLFILGRSSDPRDLIANTLGALAGISLVTAVRWIRTRRIPPSNVAVEL